MYAVTSIQSSFSTTRHSPNAGEDEDEGGAPPAAVDAAGLDEADAATTNVVDSEPNTARGW